MGKEEKQDYRPRPSSAGPERCIRQMTYHARGTTPDKEMADRFIMVLNDSSFHESLVEDWVQKSGFVLHSQQMKVECLELPFFDPPDNIMRGSIDGIVTDILGQDSHYEVKALNFYTFNRYWEGGLPLDYITQCVLYQVGLRKLVPEIHKSILLIKDKNTSALIDYVIEYDETKDMAGITEISHSNGKVKLPEKGNKYLFEIPDIIKNVIDKFSTIDRHVKEGTLPDRQYEMGEWRCDYCDYNVTCWSGYEQEFQDLVKDAEFEGEITEQILLDVPAKVDAPKKYGEIIQQTIGTLTGMPIEEVCRRHLELANELAQTDAEYETFKATIKAYLRAAGATAGRAGKYTIENKLQKQSYLNKEKIPESILMMATESRTSEMLQIREPKQKK